MSAYTRTPWQNNQFPEITAENLLKLEQAAFQGLGVDNLDSLRAIATPPAILRCAVRGSATVNDGGGGPYEWDADSTLPDDNSIVIQPSTNPPSGRWILNDGYINGEAGFQPTYDFTDVKDYNDIGETYETIGELTTPSRVSGVYEIKLSLTYSYDVTNQSVFFRWQEDGGDWNETQHEPNDKTDRTMTAYIYPEIFSGGIKNIVFQMKKENSSGILDVQFLDIIFQRVL